MRVQDVMTADLKTCPPATTVDAAAKRMREEDIGDVLVVADDGSLLGILTDRDIVVRVVAKEHDPRAVTVGDVATPDPVALAPGQELEDAAEVMRDHGVRRLPVVDEGRAVGMVSLGDLAVERDPDSALADISARPGNR